jgi:hypothetical protein
VRFQTEFGDGSAATSKRFDSNIFELHFRTEVMVLETDETFEQAIAVLQMAD